LCGNLIIQAVYFGIIADDRFQCELRMSAVEGRGQDMTVKQDAERPPDKKIHVVRDISIQFGHHPFPDLALGIFILSSRAS